MNSCVYTKEQKEQPLQDSCLVPVHRGNAYTQISILVNLPLCYLVDLLQLVTTPELRHAIRAEFYHPWTSTHTHTPIDLRS